MFDAEASEDSAKNSDGRLKSEDERSNDVEFECESGFDREENAGSEDDVDALSRKKDGNDTFKGEDNNNSGSEFDFSNVSSCIISRHELI